MLLHAGGQNVAGLGAVHGDAVAGELERGGADEAAEALREDPDIRVARRLVRDLDSGAALRRYVDLHDEPLAAVWTTDGIIRSFARGRRFPYLDLRRRDRLRGTTCAATLVRAGQAGTSKMCETAALGWLRDHDVELFEQTRISRTGSMP